MKDKRIFILGNGFDLAHFLPTAYIHFMDAMQAIEQTKENTKLLFNEIFLFAKQRNVKFFHNTEKLYKLEDFRLEIEEANNLRNKLKNNGWFQYFKNNLHNKEMSWIDFESEIENVLISFVSLFKLNFNNSTILRPKKIKKNIRDEIQSYYFTEKKLNTFNKQFLNDFGIKNNEILSMLQNFQILEKRFVIRTVENYEFIYREITEKDFDTFKEVKKKVFTDSSNSKIFLKTILILLSIN